MPHKALVTVPEAAPILEKELWRPIPLQLEWLQCKELGREICGWAEAERAYAEAGIPYPGQFQVRTQGRPVPEVIGELNKRLKALGIQPQEYGWSASRKYPKSLTTSGGLVDCPLTVPDRYRWLAVFPVTGSSEGYYLHLDCITEGVTEESQCTSTHLAIAKTWDWDNAWAVCQATAKLLEA